MANTIAVNRNCLTEQRAENNTAQKVSVVNRLKENGSLLLIAAMFVVGALMAISCSISVKSVMGNYSYDVLVILIVMELFTNLIAETGIMQMLAIKIAELSKGRKNCICR